MARTILYLKKAIEKHTVDDVEFIEVIAGDFEEQLNKAGQSVMVSNTFAGVVVIPSDDIHAAVTYIPESIAYTDIDPAALVIS